MDDIVVSKFASLVDAAANKRDTVARVAGVLTVVVSRHAAGVPWAVLAAQLVPAGVLSKPISGGRLRNIVAELLRDGETVRPARPAAPRPMAPAPVSTEAPRLVPVPESAKSRPDVSPAVLETAPTPSERPKIGRLM